MERKEESKDRRMEVPDAVESDHGNRCVRRSEESQGGGVERGSRKGNVFSEHMSKNNTILMAAIISELDFSDS